MRRVSTSYAERQNLIMRMRMRRFTRLTNAFSKKIEKHALSVALHYMHYNFARIHKTLRISPYLTHTGDAFILPREPNSGRLRFVWSPIWGMSVNFLGVLENPAIRALKPTRRGMFNDIDKNGAPKDRTKRPASKELTMGIATLVIVVAIIAGFIFFTMRR
jgi:hypothetical protein